MYDGDGMGGLGREPQLGSGAEPQPGSGAGAPAGCGAEPREENFARVSACFVMFAHLACGIVVSAFSPVGSRASSSCCCCCCRDCCCQWLAVAARRVVAAAARARALGQSPRWTRRASQSARRRRHARRQRNPWIPSSRRARKNTTRSGHGCEKGVARALASSAAGSSRPCRLPGRQRWPLLLLLLRLRRRRRRRLLLLRRSPRAPCSPSLQRRQLERCNGLWLCEVHFCHVRVCTAVRVVSVCMCSERCRPPRSGGLWCGLLVLKMTSNVGLPAWLAEAEVAVSTKVVENFETSTTVPSPQRPSLTDQLRSRYDLFKWILHPHTYPLQTPRRRPRNKAYSSTCALTSARFECASQSTAAEISVL